MTVNSLTSSAEFATDGVNRLFPFYFKFLDKKDLVVGFVNSAGVGTTLALNVDYTVTGEGDEAGGKITTTVAPAALGRLVVTRKMEATQKTALRNQGRFFAEVHETVFDRLTMLLQQAMAMASRALRTSAFEPDGIDPLPLVARRANKLLAFDVDGQPVASNLSLETLEQQPAMAAEAAAAAKVSADAAGAAASNASGSASSANASKIAAAGSASAAAGSAQAAADAGLQLGMGAWGHRPQPFKGFALDDGQELDRALYPDFVAALDAGLLPVTTEAIWQSRPDLRGYFVANSSPGKFRMRDLNGAYSGSYGGVFVRGSLASAGGQILQQQLAAGTGSYLTYANGAWMTRLYGLITPLGSAEASSLATAYASLSSRVSAVEAVPRIRRWRSGNLTINAAATQHAHGLGVVPDMIEVYLTLTTAVGGWAAGTPFRQPAGNCEYGGASGSFGHQVAAVTDNAFTLNCGAGSVIILTTGGAVQAVAASSLTVQVAMTAWV